LTSSDTKIQRIFFPQTGFKKKCKAVP